MVSDVGSSEFFRKFTVVSPKCLVQFMWGASYNQSVIAPDVTLPALWVHSIGIICDYVGLQTISLLLEDILFTT